MGDLNNTGSVTHQSNVNYRAPEIEESARPRLKEEINPIVFKSCTAIGLSNNIRRFQTNATTSIAEQRLLEAACTELPEVDWQRLDGLVPSADFVTELSKVLDPYIKNYEAIYALSYMSYDEYKEPWKCAEERLARLRSEIGQRYGKVLVELAAKGNSTEAEVILQSMEENGDVDKPDVYAELMTVASQINDIFSRVTKNGTLVPAPWVLSTIDDHEGRGAKYREIMAGIEEAFEKEVIPLRERQNEFLQKAGSKETVHDYFFRKRNHIPWEEANMRMEDYARRTQEEYNKFIITVAKSLGREPGELRPFDVDYAYFQMGRGLTHPTLTQDEAVAIAKRFVKERFGMDLDDPRHGVIFDIAKNGKHQKSAGVSCSAIKGVKVIVMDLDPEIDLGRFARILHEVGHTIYNIRAETHKGERSYSVLSTHLAPVAEAFSDSVSALVYDQEWTDKYLPEKFTREYLQSFRELGIPYKIFRDRRAMLMARAARIISDPSYKTLEEKKAAMLKETEKILGIAGPVGTDESGKIYPGGYPLGMPHLSDPVHYTYNANYVPGYFPPQMSLEEYLPILDQGGAFTWRQFKEWMKIH